MGGFLSLDNALSGTLANRRAIDVISHNIANASDEDYSRQTAELTSNKPLKIGGISVGTGVQVSGVNRARDQLIDFRFRQENTNLGKFEQLNTVFKQIEAAVNEPSDGSIRAVFQKFNESMQALSNAPENRGARRSMIGQAKTFIGVLKRMNKQFQQIAGEGGGTGQNSADAKLETLVKEINNIGKQIASLNLEINATKAAGGNPNDLLDKRTALVNDLSKKIDTNVGQDDGKFRVNVGGYTLAQGGESHTFSYEQLPGDDGKRIHYDDELRSKVVPEGGRTAALIELRDEVIPKLVKDLNDFAVQYVDRFNDIHKAGFGLDGQTRNNFFSELPTSDSGVYRFEGMGSTGGSIQDQRSGYINSPETVLTGDPSTSKPENFETDEGVLSQNAGGNNIGSPEGKLNINGNVINYDMSEDTINDIINRINDSENKATAYLSAENRLVIKGVQENDYQIDELNDTGLLMDKLNILTVGGSDRTGKNDSANPTQDLVGGGGGFGGDTRIDGLVANSDGTSGREIDLAEGTLEFESSNSANFAVNYDARDHSLNDLVTRINTESSNAGSNIAAEVTPDNRLRIFSANSSPAAALNPGVSNDPDSSFTVNDTGSQQLVNNEGPGAGTTVEVKDASVFQEGDQVRFLDDANSETTTVDAVDTTNDTITVDLSNGYTTANEASVRRVDDQNENRNLLNVLGMDRTYNKDETQTENAISGQFRRPPIEEQVAGLEINESIDNNPSQIAVAKGDDVDSDGIAETSRGKGNNENIFEMNNLRDTKILKRGSKTPDDVISEFVSSVGNEASLVQREKNAAQNLVEDIKQQRQRVSGVSLDEEITKLIRHQQAFQASARVISTVRTTTQSVLQII